MIYIFRKGNTITIAIWEILAITAIEAIQIINFQKANVAITSIFAITVIMAVLISNYDRCI